MNIDELPSLDYTSEETLQATAETRAAAALVAADGPLYFKGLELRLTPSIESLFKMLSNLDGVAETGGDRDERDAIILIYLASQPAEEWSRPKRHGLQILTPLRSRPSDWLAEIDNWFDRTFACSHLPEAVEIVGTLWKIHHAPRVILDDDAQKKTMA
jgi:hypothetical protein